MQRRTDIQASSSIITISIITILLQFAAYYFFDAFLVILGISCLISIVCCHILLEQTATYTSCFQYSILTLFISIVINGITYYGEVKTFLPYTAGMLGIALINWLIPMLHCFFRYMLDYGTRVEDFRSFYRNISIVFLFFYFVVLIYGNFAEGAFHGLIKMLPNRLIFYPFISLLHRLRIFLMEQFQFRI